MGKVIRYNSFFIGARLEALKGVVYEVTHREEIMIEVYKGDRYITYYYILTNIENGKAYNITHEEIEKRILGLKIKSGGKKELVEETEIPVWEEKLYEFIIWDTKGKKKYNYKGEQFNVNKALEEVGVKSPKYLHSVLEIESKYWNEF